jgi:cell division protein FtsL
MASILWIIILMMLVAVIIIVISIIAYNKHLDKVTKGEVHDTHSAIPEPRSTASVIYKIVLMIIVILSYLGISTANGMIGGLQTRIGELDSEVNGLRFEISNLRSQIEDRDRLIRNFEYEVSDPENNLVDVTFKLWLKEFTDSTSVSIDIAGKDVALSNAGSGMYTGSVTLSLFDHCQVPVVSIKNGELIENETVDFPEELFWDYIPTPMFSCNFDGIDTIGGKMKYKGEYWLDFSFPEKIESVTITYISNGEELETKDITQGALNGEAFTIELELANQEDLAFRTEIVTKDGFRFEEMSLMIFPAKEYPNGYEYQRIYDSDGNILYECLY